MSINKLWRISALLGSLFLLVPASVMAHQLVPESSGNSGAILHIDPQDDPVAGELSGLYYELKLSGSSSTIQSVDLTITRPGYVAEKVSTHIRGDVISAAYTFPSRNIYTLSLSVRLQTSATPFVYYTYLRVSRGVSGHAMAATAPLWATVGIVTSAWGLLVLCMSAYYQWKK